MPVYSVWKSLGNIYFNSILISYEINSQVIFFVDCATAIYDLHTPSKKAFEADMSFLLIWQFKTFYNWTNCGYS